jgi:hypothetical protein
MASAAKLLSAPAAMSLCPLNSQESVTKLMQSPMPISYQSSFSHPGRSSEELSALGSDRHRPRSLADLGERRQVADTAAAYPLTSRRAKPWEGLAQNSQILVSSGTMFPRRYVWNGGRLLGSRLPLPSRRFHTGRPRTGQKMLTASTTPVRKRTGFQPFLDLPRHTSQTLELALWLSKEEDAQEWTMLEERGWRVRDSRSVSSTPWDYRHYIQGSLGEFSCVKPSCIRFQTAWISDRTLCYLASGKPAVMQHTGPSRMLPDAAGLFRFEDLRQAAHYLEAVTADYDRQCRLGRQLAEEFFDSKKVVKSVLEIVL